MTLEGIKNNVVRKTRRTYRKAKGNVIKIGKYCLDHKEETVTMITGAACVIGFVDKRVHRHNMHSEMVRRERQIYDPSNGFYYDLKKPLSTYEKLEFDTRVRNGEPRASVLLDMGKLKL